MRYAEGATNNITGSRAAYQEFVAPIPDGMYVLHKCDNPACVNPDHLFLGTHADNMRDKVAKGRGYRPAGSKHHNAKLDEKKVREIKTRLALGEETGEAIAKQYGVSASVISGIKNGHHWRHVK